MAAVNRPRLPAVAAPTAGWRRTLLWGVPAAALLVLAAASLRLQPALEEFAPPSQVLYDVQGQVLAYKLSEDGYLRLKTRAGEVDPLYLKMLLAAEDHNFHTHPGVDFKALLRALLSNLRSGHIVSGASTLAMQNMRLLHRRARGYLAKAAEMAQAVLFTLRYGRAQVLDTYLTHAPFGSNIEGVKAAALRWFGHLPDHLTPAEAALLVALPRAPELIRPDRHPHSALYYRNEVLRLAAQRGVIAYDVLEAATQERLPQRLLPIEQRAYNLGQALFLRHRATELYSTISPTVQSVLLEEARRFNQDRLRPDQRSTLAIVVVDDLSHEIVGYLSSALPSYKLNLPQALRSPGSALKPFIYALAFEQGQLHPRTMLKDAPRLYELWRPQNYSGTFTGELAAEQALRLSLNLPALEITKSLSPAYILGRLNSGRERVVLPAHSSAQLALALGGCGISLKDLTALYSALNTDGRYFEPALLISREQALTRRAASQAETSASTTSAERSLSKTGSASDSVPGGLFLEAPSARAVFEILRGTPRPRGFAAATEVAYKTGTSFRNRDFISVGSSGSATVGVWIGRPDNAPQAGGPALSEAAPYLFDTLQKLPRRPLDKEVLPRTGPLAPNPPAALREHASSATAQSSASDLVLDFPREDTTVMPDQSGRLYLSYHGGVPPYYLMLDGQSAPDEHYVQFTQGGAHRLSVLDAAGHSAAATVWVVFER
ncbi:MAG: transglycosylase domain-containing protein [Succinivibrio sp.]|nr:transglycosylase domain-containing protein [Succinivibrio sp.]